MFLRLPLFLFRLFCPPSFSISLSLSLSLSLSHLSLSLLSFVIFLFPSFLFLMSVLVLVFSFCFVCFLFQDVLVLFFCLLSCLVLNYNIDLCVFCILFSCCCFFVCFCCFGILLFFIFRHLSKNMSQKLGYCKKNKNEKMHKITDILTRAVSTSVLTNSVFPFFVVL